MEYAIRHDFGAGLHAECILDVPHTATLPIDGADGNAPLIRDLINFSSCYQIL